MPKLQIKWKIHEKQTGPFAAFRTRGWPDAFYKNVNENIALSILCKDDYSARRVKEGNHDVLIVRVADYSDKSFGSFKWKQLKARFTTLDVAKKAGLAFLVNHPEYWPESMRDNTEVS